MLKIDNLPDEQEEKVQHACVVFRAELLICINEQILYNRIFFYLLAQKNSGNRWGVCMSFLIK